MSAGPEHAPPKAAAAQAERQPRRSLIPHMRMVHSVRGKVMAIVLLTTAIALLVAGAAMLTRDLGAYRRSWASDLAMQSSILASSITPALEFDDHDAAERALGSLRVRPELRVAALYGADGSLYALYQQTAADAVPAHVPRIDGPMIAGDRVEVIQQLVQGGDYLGALYLRANYDLAARVRAYLSIFAAVILLCMSVAFVLSSRLQRIITAPLGAMAAVARRVMERRDYSLRAHKISDDEIGVVVDAFNRMLEQVQWHAQALEQSNQAMRDADRRKDEFLATLAHELRNPLAPIQQAVRILDSKANESQQRWAREVIARQAQRMALLLDDLLDVARITSGRLSLKIESVGLSALVATAIETARPLIDKKQHTLTVELPPAPLLLQVDPLRLSQALSNLLTNAAKYTDPKGVIRLQIVRDLQGLRLSVTDNGIGIAPGAIARLFEMFSQVESAIDRTEGGLGIGLSLVKGLVALHGGEVSVESAGPGCGSTFHIRLPPTLLRDEGPIAFAPSPPPSEAGLTGRVLVVDDNVDAAQTLGLALRMSGFETQIVHAGREALQAGAEHPPDAIILDIGMRDMNGYETARRIRAEPWGRGLLLVALTGWGQQEDKDRSRMAGFDLHLTKPVDLSTLEGLLRDFLAQRQNSADTDERGTLVTP